MKEIVKNILKEAFFTKHLDERFYTRFLNFEPKKIGYEIKNSFGDYVELGEMILSKQIVENIKNKLEMISTFQFVNWKSYAIKLADLSIDTKTDKIYWDFDGAEDEAKGKTLIYLDNETNSNGDLVYVIIRNNEVTTIMFAKSYIKVNSSKLKVDMVIDNFENIYNLKNKN
jgi:hypothetical protein